MKEETWVRKFKDRKLTEFNRKPQFKVGNVEYLQEDEVPIDYIVLKIGDKTFSTKIGTDTIAVAKLQLVKTKEIGHENNLWLKGVFTEGKNHQPIRPIPFELNIYTKVIINE